MVTQNWAARFVLEGVSKRYGGVTALNEVDFALATGKIHALLGENGAGKSTLIKVMTGVVAADAGRLRLDGQPVSFPDPLAANRAGVVCVFQELSLLPHLSVAENISLGDPPRRFGLIDRAGLQRRAQEVLARIGCSDVDPRARVADLSLSRRQMVEIAKALGKNPEVLILDEATSALSHQDVELLFEVLHGLRAQGVSILYVSHRMHEIERLADVLSVFRNGCHIDTFAKGERNKNEIVEMMIGRELTAQYPPKPAYVERPAWLSVRDLSWNGGRLNKVSFTAGQGEIVGLGGLDGQGQNELLLALFGVLKGVEGTVELAGRRVRIDSPRAAKSARHRIAMIPQDRKTEGLLLSMSVADNLALTALDEISAYGLIDETRETALVNEAVGRLQIRLGSVVDAASTLSGGNQQKVVIAKWLLTRPQLILLNDPTRGIDVGTKQEIYTLLRALAAEGAAIVLYASDYDELIACCDRVEVMYDGAIVASLAGEAITEQALLSSALNLGVTDGDRQESVTA